MRIERQKPEDSTIEQYLITALIMSGNVCRSLRRIYDNRYFQTRMTRTLSDWIVNFFDSYDDAPKTEIQSIFDTKSKAGAIEPDLEEEVEALLGRLSNEYEDWEDFNEQYYVDMGRRYFKKRNHILHASKVYEAASEGDIDEADRLQANFASVQSELDTSREVTNPRSAAQKLKESIENQPPHMFTPPGAMGDLIGPVERETFMALLGREKVGKTYHLQALAVSAAKQGLNVAMLETGDLSQDQIDTRYMSYITNKVSKESRAGRIWSPVMDCIHNQLGTCEDAPGERVVKYDEEKGLTKFDVDITDRDVMLGHCPCNECHKDRHLRHFFRGSVWWEEMDLGVWSWREARTKWGKFHKRFGGRIVTDAFPMYTAKASDIRDWCIHKQKNEGFIPDLLVVDYPDILLPEHNGSDFRHQENEKWMILKRISQEFHNCVCVVTQADAKSYSRDTLGLDNYSEDKRKYAHTTHFIAINKTMTEERFGCARLSKLVLRENDMKVSGQVTLLQRLATSRAHLASFEGRVPAM